MTEWFELVIDKSDVVDLACAIELGNRAAAADSLNRLVGNVIGGENGDGRNLVEWIAQGRALADRKASA